MAKKQTAPKKEKVIYTESQVEEAMNVMVNICNEWKKDSIKMQKVVSLRNQAVKWNKTGEGKKTILNNIEKNIRSLNLMNKRYPNMSYLNMIEDLKKEYVDKGGSLSDLK